MKAHELLADPKHWTKRAYARDKDGQSVSAHSDEAVCWCVLGAIIKCYGYLECPESRIVRTGLIEKYKHGMITNFNDIEASHEQVVSLLKELDV